MELDTEESDNDRVCYAVVNICFAQTDLVTQEETGPAYGANRQFQDIMRKIKCGNWKQCLKVEKLIEKQKDALTTNNGVIFRGVIPFIPSKPHITFGKSRWDTSWEDCHRCISQNDNMVAWFYPGR